MRANAPSTITFTGLSIGPGDRAKWVRAGAGHCGSMVDATAPQIVVVANSSLGVAMGGVAGTFAFGEMGDESITLLQAIGMAEGFTRIANRKKVTIKRRVGGREVIMRIDAKRLASEGSSRPVEILVGDVITVAESMF